MNEQSAVARPRLSYDEAFRARWREEGRSAQSTQLIPYPGLRSFGLDERAIFKARAGQIEALERALSFPYTASSARHLIMVIGGSSSGKSSVVKAGLLAGIDSLEMPGRPGNWYIAECRPVKEPMLEILQGLARMLVDKAVAEAAANYGSHGIRSPERERQIRVAMEIVAPGCPSPGRQIPENIADASDYAAAVDFVKKSLVERIWGEPQRNSSAAMTRAFSAFVHLRLNEFDMALFPDPEGPPRLLLSIDQFEEIFRNGDLTTGNGAQEKDAALQKEAVFELLRAADRADRAYSNEENAHPMGHGDECRLFIVTSMRSEEVHRCSQERELAEIFNRAVHLVQLVQREDARAAIVEPAQHVLMRYRFPFGEQKTYPYAAEAVEAILDAYDESCATVEHRADALSLLQHFLRILWRDSIKAWVDSPSGAKLLIDKAALSRISGWDMPAPGAIDEESGEQAAGETRLARVLNSRAGRVFKRAIAAWLEEAGVKEKDEKEEERARSVIQAALISMVRFDDNRRVVRDWKTLDQMLDDSLEKEKAEARLKNQNPEAYHASIDARFRQPLRAALQTFERATLIECRADAASATGSERAERYAVYHESFIRNWRDYGDWVKEAGKAVAALRAIHEEISQSKRDANDQPTAKPEEIVTGAREGDLRAVIGMVEGLEGEVEKTQIEKYEAENRDANNKKKNKRPWASRAWATAEIMRASAGRDASRVQPETIADFRRRGIEWRYKIDTADARNREDLAKKDLQIAEEKRIGQKNWSLGLSIAGGAFVVVGIIGGSWYYNNAIDSLEQAKIIREANRETQIQTQKYYAAKVVRIGFESTDFFGAREARFDRDAWLALNILENDKTIKWDKDDATRRERNIAGDTILQRLRQPLGDAVYSVNNDMVSNGKSVTVVCSDGKEVEVNDVIDNEKNLIPKTFVFKIENKQLSYSANGRPSKAIVNIPSFDSDTALCAAKNGRALLVKSMREGRPWVFMIMINWTRRGTNTNADWWLQAEPRYTQTVASANLFNEHPVGVLTNNDVAFVSTPHIAAFTLPVANKEGAKSLLWTNDGFSSFTLDREATPDDGWTTVNNDTCQPTADPAKEQCSLQGKTADGSRRAVAIYFRPKGEKFSCSGEDAQTSPSNDFCDVRLDLWTHNIPMRFGYRGRPFDAISIGQDWLRLKGDDGIIRKIDLRSETARVSLELRLRDLPPENSCQRDGNGGWEKNPSAEDIPGFYTQDMKDASGKVFCK